MSGDTKRENMTAMIGKLLRQADSVPGTKEAEAFEAKAFALLAEYGIAESEARGTKDEQAGSNVVEALTFQLKGKYLRQQIDLLCHIGSALHCENVIWPADGKVVLYGVRVHTSRVRILFAMLAPRMIAQAGRETAPWWSDVSTRAYRISWMSGYIYSIKNRLAEAEKRAADERDAQTSSASQALVLVSDKDRAQKAMEKANPRLKKDRYRPALAEDALRKGIQAGLEADLDDQNKLGGARRGIAARA
ncbi:DUF2786 domain-containing protein [Tsukamurella spumae]|uniref:DUF2786 domain-containing protein n=1 Tax=Tsukamurella spumae TaxID=44753 RepID=A0A846X2Z2_9ACTN|nr:DUF2786 domain-containing protein [Tsukamurella spumae]NKY19461.1 DUF2786 domain-containing protein [Tsukamurella spumae]